MPLARAQKWAAPLQIALDAGGIHSRKAVAAFLAQVGHESGSFYYTKELGGPEYLKKYEGRKDLGNVKPGDGVKFAGRGLVQVTGRANYAAASQALFGDDRLLSAPEILEQAEWAAKSAVWFWNSRGLTALAESDQFDKITRKINGGTNGAEDRNARYAQALKVLA